MFHEAHAGFTCCAISALYLVDRLPLSEISSQQADHSIRGVSNLPLTLRWLVSRQTLALEEGDAVDSHQYETDSIEASLDAHSFVKLKSYPSKSGGAASEEPPRANASVSWVGFNGRCNKIADTCYAYWVCTPLSLLNHLGLIDPKPIRRWLLDKTQHLIGGFGKISGDPPDIYHSYLGLGVLAMFGEPGLKGFDAALCMSTDAKRHLESLEWRKSIVGTGQKVEGAEAKVNYMSISGG